MDSASPTAITIVAAAIGGGIASIVGAVSQWLTRRAEARRHYRELGVEIARLKFEQCQALAQQTANATGKFIPMPPFDAFLMQSIKLMEIVSDSSLTAEQVEKRVAGIKPYTDAIKNPFAEPKPKSASA